MFDCFSVEAVSHVLFAVILFIKSCIICVSVGQNNRIGLIFLLNWFVLHNCSL